jgi:hypothetical protein
MSIVRGAMSMGLAAWLGLVPGRTAAAADPGAAMISPLPGEVEQARKKAAEGERFFARKDYPAALDKIEEAYRLDPNPALKFNLGQIHQALGHDGAAVSAFERFLLEVPDAPARQRRAALRQTQSLRPRLGTVEVVCDVEGAEISVDGEAQGSTPQSQSIWVTPGSHVVLVRVPGTAFGYAQRIDAVAGTAAQVSAQLAPLVGTGAPDPHAPASPPIENAVPGFEPRAEPPAIDGALSNPEPVRSGVSWGRRTAWIAAGGAVAGLVVAGLAEAVRQRDVARFNDHQSQDESGRVIGRCVSTEYERGGGPCAGYYDDIQRDRRLSIGGVAVSGALLITAAVAFVISSGDSEPESHASVSATPTVAIGRRDVTLNWRF